MSARRKKFGVVYTPGPVVEMMLDKLPTLKDRAICDPACGDGRFLAAIAERVCRRIRRCRTEAGRQAYYSTLRRLTGLDIDREALRRCRRRLNDILRRHGCDAIRWRLLQADAIDRKSWEALSGFDYVIGNPPYVRIQHLEADRRARINNGEWSCMQGCADLFILFFEMGLRLLKSGGRLVYITPNSWMKSASGKALRRLVRNYELRSITDFGDYQVFQDVTTYTAITEIAAATAGRRRPQAWKCAGFAGQKPVLTKARIHYGERGWQALTRAEAAFMRAMRVRDRRLIDVADIHVGIQTLADDVFIFPEGAVDVEPGIVRRVTKASVMKNGKDTMRRVVVYPYIHGKLMAEEALQEQYPKAHAYLSSHKKRLLARDKGTFDRAKWYGFGREVSIVSGFGVKLLTSPMNPAPNFQPCPDPDALFYSGYCVKPKKGVSPAALLRELNSESMRQYIRLVSRPFRNGWFSYAKSFIQDYPVPESVYARQT